MRLWDNAALYQWGYLSSCLDKKLAVWRAQTCLAKLLTLCSHDFFLFYLFIFNFSMCFLFWFAPSVHAPPRGSFSVRTMRQVDGTCSHILAAAFITGGLKINSLEARAEFSAACPNLNKVLVCHTSQIITSCNASVKGYFNIELLSCTPSFLVTIPSMV